MAARTGAKKVPFRAHVADYMPEHLFRPVANNQADSLLSAWHQLPYVAYIERLAGVARQRIIYGHSSNVNDTCHYGFVVGC